MRLLKNIFFVFISVIVGLYLGGKHGICLTENNIVDLGATAGNLLYPLFWLIMAVVGGILSGLTGLIIVIILSRFHKPNKDKRLNNNYKKGAEFKPWGMEQNQFCMLLHLSQFASLLIPLAGIVLPIAMWASNKGQSELVDKQGKNILNWLISCLIYLVISSILSFILIGIPLLIILGICSLIFTITGVIKANDGIVYTYPLTMTFIR